MHIKNFIIYWFVFSIGIFFFSCSTTKKINFKDAYKFSYYNYQNALSPESNLRDVNQPLYASTKVPLDYLERKPIEILIPEGRKYSKVALDNLTKARKKELRRKIKDEIKQIKIDLKNNKKDKRLISPGALATSQDSKGMNQKIYIGILVGAAGLILLIVNVATILGVLALVAGLGLIVWGFIEKGSF